MEAETCPRCKTNKYNNPSLKLMVNVCGHTLCESCVDLLFLKGSGSCPECLVPLRRNNYRVQMFEDPYVEKEVDIRRRILREYNKKEEDFPTLREYNDYLEEIEVIVHNLCNNINVIDTNKRIEAYKRENRELILRNRMRISREEQELEDLLQMERMQEEMRRKELTEMEMEAKRKRIQVKEAMIDELMHSNKNANEIVEHYIELAKKNEEESKKLPPIVPPTQFSTGIKIGGAREQDTPAPEEEGPPFVYKPLVPVMDGPTPPSLIEIETKGYDKHIRPASEMELGGGYRTRMAAQRILQEAMQGLYQSNDDPDNSRQ